MGFDMSAIQNKLQKERTIEGKCKYVHKYMRFAKNNKTYRRDVYFCILCGHKVKIEEIVGKYTQCWKCGKPFSIPVAMLKLRPTCSDCNNKTRFAVPVENLSFLDDEQSVTKDEVMNELLRDVGLK